MYLTKSKRFTLFIAFRFIIFVRNNFILNYRFLIIHRYLFFIGVHEVATLSLTDRFVFSDFRTFPTFPTPSKTNIYPEFVVNYTRKINSP